MPDWKAIAQQIGDALGRPFSAGRPAPVGGGCINQAYVLGDGATRVFVKLNQAAYRDMFEAEAEGLAEIAASRSIGVPAPLCHGVAGAEAFLAMTYLELGGSGAAEQLGRDLARMHRCTPRARFGWQRDNTIGSTPQPNTPCDDWVRFWQQRRLGHQLALAAGNGAGRELRRRGEQLLAEVPAFFTDYRPAASLLHGDLWSGNYAYTRSGQPVIFDPAVYFGDRETDLAMTELFGGFPAGFYAAYHEAYPLDAGYGVRKSLYNLYHILNHFNLFGGGYLGQAQGMIDRLLSELR
jgi:protein-ribulosamine 3-kinase